MSSEVARIRIAAGTALVAALVTAIPPAAALFHHEGSNPLYFGDAALLAILAWGLLRESRIFAVILVIYWIASKIIQLIASPGLLSTPADAAVAFVVLAVFVSGAVTIFRRHSMKNAPLLVGLVLALSLAGCHAQSPNAAAFSAAAANVASVKEVVIPGNVDLDAAITKLGGFPVSADVAVSKKAIDVQYAIGKDKDGKAVVAVSLAKDGTVTVVTDPDIAGGYAAKVKTLIGEKSSSSTASTGSSTSSGPGGASGSNTPKKKIGPFYIGMTMDEAKAKCSAVGTTFSRSHEGSDHEVWYVTPLQAGHVQTEAVGSAIGSMGFFSGPASMVAPRAHIRSYTLTFSGNVISDIDVTN